MSPSDSEETDQWQPSCLFTRNLGRTTFRSCFGGGPGDEPHHAQGHVLRFAAEAVDLVEEGSLDEVAPEDVVALMRIRDLLIKLL
jgi:hypothetical protein